MENNNSLTHIQRRRQKQTLAAVTSVLGNIKIHFPETELAFLAALGKHYPDLHVVAVKEGYIKAPKLPTDEGRLLSLIRDCPPH